MRYILAINTGSSSLKVAIFNAADVSREFLHASLEGIGQTDTTFTVTGADIAAEKKTIPGISAHTDGARFLANWIEQKIGGAQIDAIGHRVVHGGEMFSEPLLLTNEVISGLVTLKDLDPDHMPVILDTMQAFHEFAPGIPHVACFDTAFYRDAPRMAKLLPLPRRLEAQGVRRYGFHGLSYSYLLDDFSAKEGSAAAHGRVIMAHMGSGVSLVALKDGAPVDMTMAFTPASGVPMSTRSGDLDPGVAVYLQRSLGMDVGEFNDMINKQSGLLGVSETTADMATLLQIQADDPRAAEAVEMFCYHLRKAIGSLSATLGGLDSLIFAGGIGERSAEVRGRICADLGFLGVELDEDRNTTHARLISREGAKVGVHVIPTNESIKIAELTARTVKERQSADN